jgi:hypothetical protein
LAAGLNVETCCLDLPRLLAAIDDPQLEFAAQSGPSLSFKDIKDLYQAIRPVYKLAAKQARQQARKAAEWRKANPDVTSPNLVEIGRSLAHPALSLAPQGDNYAAVWLGTGVVPEPEGEGHHRISIACDALPVNPRKLTGVISVYEGTRAERFASRHVAIHDPRAKLPRTTDGTKLYGTPFESLPPVQFLFKRGPAAVKKWLKSQDWDSEDPSSYMPDHEPARWYLDAWFANHPVLTNQGYAMLGGWLMPFPEGDWEELVGQTLLLTTIKDAEPYIELWDDGKSLRCIPRIT